MNISDANHELKNKLAAWRVEPDFRPEFNREVWRKMAASKSVQRENLRQNLFAILFAAPRFATVSLAALAMLTLGIGSAHLAARSANSRSWTMLEERYAESIDPVTRSASMKQ